MYSEFAKRIYSVEPRENATARRTRLIEEKEKELYPLREQLPIGSNLVGVLVRHGKVYEEFLNLRTSKISQERILFSKFRLPPKRKY